MVRLDTENASIFFSLKKLACSKNPRLLDVFVLHSESFVDIICV